MANSRQWVLESSIGVLRLKKCDKIRNFLRKKVDAPSNCETRSTAIKIQITYFIKNRLFLNWAAKFIDGQQCYLFKQQKFSSLGSCPGVISYRLSHKRARSVNPLKRSSGTDRRTDRQSADNSARTAQIKNLRKGYRMLVVRPA
jgi:hypothetical protein